MRKMQLVDRERYEVLRKMLQVRGQEIAEKMRSLRESLPDELAEVKDPEEQCADEFVRGLDFALIEMKSLTLARINEALQRLEEGTYGLCVDCQEPITAARLHALPFADRCLDCQQGREEIAAEASKQRSVADVEPAPPVAIRRPVRRARPGQLALRREVASMDRASRRPIEPPSAPTPSREPRGAAVRPARIARTTKHA